MTPLLKSLIEETWVKIHIMVGVKTHVVTSVESTPTESADSPQLPYLPDRTVGTFDINKVSADKAGSDHKNVHGVHPVPFLLNGINWQSAQLC